MSDNDMDRTEQATPYRLQKAREQGQVAKSTDVVSVVTFVTAIVYLYWRGPQAIEDNFRFARALLAQAGMLHIDEVSFWWLAGRMVRHMLTVLGPFFLAIALMAIIGNLVQTGPMFTLAAFKVDLTRLNPVQGLKKMFERRKLFDTFRACFKLLVLAFVVYHALKGAAAEVFTYGALPPRLLLKTVAADIASIGFKMALALALIAAVDFIYSRREFGRKMRMSRRDIKDEVKNREGDPRIRSRLRQLRQEMFKRSSSTRNTRNADVVIVNPTHVAVALKYVHGEMQSPLLLAKGTGAFAAAMRTIAANHNIPIVQNVSLARKLFREMEIDQHVPPAMYADVARIIVWVFAMRKARGADAAHAGAAPGAFA
jgi:flagellar biosynthetic protein FlhB